MNDNNFIGINLGSKKTVIGCYKESVVGLDKDIKFEIVLIKNSERSIQTIVSFNDRDRIREIGDIGEKNIKCGIVYPNRWLGIEKDYDIFEKELKYAYTKPICNERNNNILSFKIKFKKNEDYYTPQSLMGLFFNKLKNEWKNKGINTNNVVVSVPDYYIAKERIAMLEAIRISGLNCTGLLNESSAICLGYGIQKMKDFNTKDKRNVIFIDFGHSHTSIIYCSFIKNKFNLKYVLSDRFLGARDFDYEIAKKVSGEFLKKNPNDPLDIPKAKYKLFKEVNMNRKKLNENKELHLHVDNLIGEDDLDYKLKREEFEIIVEPVLTKFENLCKEFLEKSRINLNDIHSIEMVSNTLRTPVLKNIIKKIFGRELSTTLIPDEIISQGCALYSIVKSQHKIQLFSFNHYNPYDIDIEYITYNNEKKNENLFLKGENIGLNREYIIPGTDFKNKANILLNIVYKSDIPELDFIENKILYTYNITLPNEIKNNNNVCCEFSLDENIIPKLKKAFILDNNETNNNNINNQFPKVNEELNFEVITSLNETPTNKLNELINRENIQENEDLKIIEAKEYRNSIEKYIYEIKHKLEDGELDGCYSENEKDELNQKMNELIDWFYKMEDDDLYDKNKIEIRAKSMKQLGDKIYKRFNEKNSNNSNNLNNNQENELSNQEKKPTNSINNDINQQRLPNNPMNNNKQMNSLNNNINQNQNIPKNNQFNNNFQKMNNIGNNNIYQQMPINNIFNNNYQQINMNYPGINQMPLNPQMNFNQQNVKMNNQFYYPMNQQGINQGINESYNNNFNLNKNNSQFINLIFFSESRNIRKDIKVNINEYFASVIDKYVSVSNDNYPNIYFYNGIKLDERLTVKQCGLIDNSIITMKPLDISDL